MATITHRRYIGGDHLSQSERERLYLRRLRSLPIQHDRWPVQCFCGTCGYVVYRGRYYCPRCGHKWNKERMNSLIAESARNAEKRIAR